MSYFILTLYVNFNSADDDHRVQLADCDNDYINASLVKVPEASREYILTQVGVYPRSFIQKSNN